MGPFPVAADPFGTETQGKRGEFPTREALRKKLTLTLEPCCEVLRYELRYRTPQTGLNLLSRTSRDQQGTEGRDRSAILSDIPPASAGCRG